jgi:hypothetical protein
MLSKRLAETWYRIAHSQEYGQLGGLPISDRLSFRRLTIPV